MNEGPRLIALHIVFLPPLETENVLIFCICHLFSKQGASLKLLAGWLALARFQLLISLLKVLNLVASLQKSVFKFFPQNNIAMGTIFLN